MARSGIKRAVLWRLSLAVAPEAADAAAELLGQILRRPVCIEQPIESPCARVLAYLEGRAWWARVGQHRWRVALATMRAAGLQVGPARLRLTRLSYQNWAESWKKHFRPFIIGGKLLIKPSWSSRQPARRQVALVLDPGLSFGTGHHPTTRFCLEQMVAFRKQDKPQSFLDIGTGSGILAIAAAKLGYRPVRGFDIDPAAVQVARANARRNRLPSFHPTVLDLANVRRRAGRRYDLVCANLISEALIQHRGLLAACVRPGGRLVVAGILTSQFKAVRHALAEANLRLVSSRTEGEWRSGVFTQLAGKSDDMGSDDASGPTGATSNSVAKKFQEKS